MMDKPMSVIILCFRDIVLRKVTREKIIDSMWAKLEVTREKF